MDIIEESVYHGTIQEYVSCILTDGFQPSNNGNDWLGRGIYFFKYMGHARNWALQVSQNSSEPHVPSIVVADLLYQKHNLLDLDDPDQLVSFNAEISEYLEAASRQVISANLEQHKHKKWDFCCNLYRKIHKEIFVTTYTFSFNRKKDKAIYPANQKQICVSNSEVIKRVYLPELT